MNAPRTVPLLGLCWREQLGSSSRHLACDIHSSAPAQYLRRKNTSGKGNRIPLSSRTRLADSLKPRSKGGRFEYASSSRTPQSKKLEKTSSGPSLALNAPAASTNLPVRARVENPLGDEFALATRGEAVDELPRRFTSPPLNEGLLTCVKEILGTNPTPTPIQALAVKHLVESKPPGWSECLLASETGSGKSFAYMIPLLHNLKASEATQSPPRSRYATNPRALIIAPTHELARQLAGFAKNLTHVAKLRVLCASRANVPNATQARPHSASLMARSAFFHPPEAGTGAGEFSVQPRGGAGAYGVDVLVGTSKRLLEMVRGHGWDRGLDVHRPGRPRSAPPPDFVIGRPEMGLERVEWVIVDEADVLFDADFQQSTRLLLADISAARGRPLAPDAAFLPKADAPRAPVSYPFNLVMATATVPAALATYLDAHHPRLLRLVSPGLHKLPRKLQVEHAAWTGGNRNADVLQRLRDVWRADAAAGEARSKVLVFFNKGSKVEECAAYLKEKGVRARGLTGASEERERGSNRHLADFLKPRPNTKPREKEQGASGVPVVAPAHAVQPYKKPEVAASKKEEDPCVLVTTSLLSRGLDFDASVRHVFIADEPRNMIDFLHRAGRVGRAGVPGTVVVFGKAKGRGAERGRELKRKVWEVSRRRE